MGTSSASVEVDVENDERLAGTFLAPKKRVPGMLFVHGWGGSQERDLERARAIAGLGCVCLTFDLRGHAGSRRQSTVTREDNLRDIVAAYDRLLQHPSVDPGSITVAGTSYGGYLSAILTTVRPVRWLSLRVPSLYRDAGWLTPKQALDREDLASYRASPIAPEANRALRACASFTGDVLLVESEHDHLVPHATLMSYRGAFQRSHSMTHRIIVGADHALSRPEWQRTFTAILASWVTEMIVGARVGSCGDVEADPC